MDAIDLNADLGESVGGLATADDEAMFALVSSASIACGGHAGDDRSMALAVERARHAGVAVGAHPAYPDPEGFGRRALQMPTDRLRDALDAQLAALVRAGADVRYVKPHGALYHAVGGDPEQAGVLVGAVLALSERVGRPVPVLGLGPALARACAGVQLPFVAEAFLDRGYLPGGGLVPRERPGALREDPDDVARRAVRLVRERVVDAVDGRDIPVEAASLCLHGDTPAAVRLGEAVRAALEEAGVEVRAPW